MFDLIDSPSCSADARPSLLGQNYPDSLGQEIELPLEQQTEFAVREYVHQHRHHLFEPIVDDHTSMAACVQGPGEDSSAAGTPLHSEVKFEGQVLRRLISLANNVRQSRSAIESRDRDLNAVFDHMAQMYSHLTLTYKVAATLHRNPSLLGLIAATLNDLQTTFNADAVGLFVAKSRHLPEIKLNVPDTSGAILVKMVEPFLASISGKELLIDAIPRLQNQERPSIGSVCSASIRTADGRLGWLVAIRTSGHFGTEEGQLLRSLANVLTGQIDTAALLAEQEQILLAMIRSFVSALDARDQYTRGHSERVADIAAGLAGRLGLSASACNDIHLAGLLHDIGKIGISDDVLRKTDQLTAEDWIEIKRHPVIGENILQGITLLEKILPGVRSHHESFDGRGYPDGLVGEQIPYLARILAVADAFDAMSSDRPYRKGKSPKEVEAILSAGAGKQWDPQVVRAFLANQVEIRTLWQLHFESPTAGPDSLTQDSFDSTLKSIAAMNSCGISR